MVETTENVEILLVEDNAIDAELCIRALRQHNISKPVEFEEFSKVVADMGMYWFIVSRSPQAK